MIALASLCVATLMCGAPTSPSNPTRSASSDSLFWRLNVTSVTVALADSELLVGDTTAARAIVRDAQGRTFTRTSGVSWSSSNSAVATVSSSGHITARAHGSVTIAAAVRDVSGSARLAVNPIAVDTSSPPPPPPPTADTTPTEPQPAPPPVDTTPAPPPPPPPPPAVASVSVSVVATTITVDGTTTATATVRDASGNTLSGRSVEWSSSNSAVASVDAAGNVRGVAVGGAHIIATSEGVTGNVTVDVEAPAPPPPPPPPPPPAVGSVSVSVAASTILVGGSTTAQATVLDASGNPLTVPSVEWSSSNAAVASVDAAGVVRGVAAGSAQIVATSEGVSGNASVTVQVPPPPPPAAVASVSVSLAASTILVGGSTTAAAIVRDASGNPLSGRSIAWSSSNAAVASVGASGTVRGLAVGTAQVTATSERVTGTASVTVQAPPPPQQNQSNILNNVSFEGGWEGFGNWSAQAPSGVTRDGARALDGSISIKKVLPITSGSDIGSQFVYSLAKSGSSYDRVWGRFYFYLDAAINGILKLNIWFDPAYAMQFGGVYLEGGYLSVFHTPEINQMTRLRSLSGLTNGWHSIEVDYWRNGDTSNGGNNYPSIAIWLDGEQITSGTGAPAGSARWINGRLNFGARASSAKLGQYELLGLINGNPRNTIPGNIWVDRVSLSSLGRIGN